MAATDRRAVLAFALYDWGNSAFTTLVVTFIYSAWFTKAMAPDPVAGTVLWSRGVSATALLVAASSPLLGALADRRGWRWSFLLLSTFLCVGATAVLAFIGPGRVLSALTAFVAANLAFELGMVFYNSYLPEIARPEQIGRVSGLAWGLGYAGGLVCLGLALVLFVLPASPRLALPGAGGNIRATNLLAAAWYLVFALPFLLTARRYRRPPRPAPDRADPSAAWRRISAALRATRRYRQTWRFLLARMLYNDGLVTVFAFGGIFAAGTFGFDFTDLIVFGIALNLAAGLGAWAFGHLDDRIGARATILWSLAALLAAVALAVTARSLVQFWLAGTLIGIFAGPNQAASRSLLGRFAPREHESQFYGLFALLGQAHRVPGAAAAGRGDRSHRQPALGRGHPRAVLPGRGTAAADCR